MKKLTFLLLGLLGLTMVSCSDEDPSINIYGKEKITTPAVLEALPAPAEFTPIKDVNEADKAGTFTWTAATLEYDGAVSYNLQIAKKGSDFSLAVNVFNSGVSTTTRDFTFGDLNTAVNRLNFELISNGKTPISFDDFVDYDVRVVATAEVSKSTGYSEVQSLKIHAYSDPVVITPTLFMVGAPQAYYGGTAWDVTKGIQLKYIGSESKGSLFECYVQIKSGDGLKFTGDGKTWDEGNYGTLADVTAITGGQEFDLVSSGESKDLKIAGADGDGLYYIQVNLTTKKCKAIKMNWGVIGAATPLGWGGETAMTYNFSANEWTYPGTDITAGKMKFRSKNTSNYFFGATTDWEFNVGTELGAPDHDGGSDLDVTAGAHPKLKVGFDGKCTVTDL
ncbi:MAG TPA: SusE domain-containing protein [Flavobacterium sp.]|uniref:SusE domain-containing protein n=1 Tax=Flavobacterium sp. TaxID=239 RepID=UPI002DBE0FDB|nr:SusE domain-containing protein [Flavobacterium sp.]HEU4789042.1 SusE domain-containing protein [Flavobacterium sp.]